MKLTIDLKTKEIILSGRKIDETFDKESIAKILLDIANGLIAPKECKLNND